MDKRRYALVVATSEYRNEQLRKLSSPIHDVNALAKVLRDPDIGGFEVTSIRNKASYLIGPQIEQFLAGRGPDDTVLLYFSGHGIKDDAGNLYLAARNTTRPLLRSTGIADAFLKDVMKTCRARKQVLILDCCFGGAFAKGLLSKAGGDSVEVTERFEGQGRVILTASTAMEFALEEEGAIGQVRLSVFTRMLVEGLRTGAADVDRDDWISVQDLYDYAYKRIAIPGSHQTPTISAIGQEGSIFLAQVPKTARATTRVSQPLMPTTGTGTGTARRPDLRPWVHIRDQGNEGANAAVAAVTALETFLALRGKKMRLSPRYVYQKAKELQGVDPSADVGIEMDKLAKVLEEHGVPPEEDWPYKPGTWKLPKGTTWKELDKRALPYRAQLIPVKSTQDILQNLGNGRPVLAAFDAYASTWLDSGSAKGVIAKPSHPAKEQPIGSVATTIVDFDSDTQSIRFAHTWGERWGNRGFGEMSVEAAKVMFKGKEMWAVEVNAESSFDWAPTTFTPEAPGLLEATSAASRRKPPRPTPDKTKKPLATRTALEPGGPRRAVYDAKHRMGEWSNKKLPAKSLARAEGDPPTGDSAVDETYMALGAFHRFVHEVFGRDSWDGKGGALESVVHYGQDFENAFWDGHRVVLGDGGGEVFRHFYQLDVIAKECSLGLVQSETELTYQGQPGALIQSLGLVFASMVKQYHIGQTAAQANWLIGEGLLTKGQALVSLERPGTAYNHPVLGKDPQVGHMSKYEKVPTDNGGIHINCGIPNRAFALLAKALKGHSWERAGRIWYDAVCTGKLGPKTTFRQFAQRTVAIAKARFPDVADAVRQAWSDVGIAV